MLPALLLLATATSPIQTFEGPLEPAKQGLIRCVSPDPATRTCSSIARYTLRQGGDYDAVVTGLITTDPVPVVLEYSTTGILRNGAVCAVIKPTDLAAGKMTSGGAAVSPAIEARVRARLTNTVAPLAGKMRCYREQVEGDTRTAIVTIDGVGHPEMTQNVIWVRPEDGYKVSG